MSRVIKFRAWDEQAKVMHEDFRFIKSGDDGYDWIIFTSHLQTLQEKHHPFDNPYFQQQFKVMQFTGLTDANGVEIYEGDIVVIPDQYIWFDGEKPNYVGVVEMVFSQWSCIAHCVNKEKAGISNGINYNLNDEGFEDGENSCWLVIGSIYQNPELLNHG